MRRRAHVKGAQQVAELCLCLLVREADRAEYLLELAAPVCTQAPAYMQSRARLSQL